MIVGIRRTIVDNDWGVLGVLLVFFAGAVFGSRAAHVDSGVVNWAAWADSFLQNAGTEMFGAALTFGLIEMLRGARREREAEKRETEERKARLIRQLGSRVNEEAMRAAEELRVAGWLRDGSLRGATLGGANLQGADLRGAILQEASLQGAKLQEATLVAADLSEATLFGANLQEANLALADLQRTDLALTNLQGTDLALADLQGARGVTPDQLQATGSLQGTTLPDGTRLPVDDTWHEAFEAWCETVPLDEKGFIVPAPLDDAGEH